MPLKSLLLLCLAAGSLSVFAAECDPGFFDGVRYGMTEDSHHLIAGDFDSDGTPDLASMSFTSRKIELLLNRTANFVHGPAVTLPSEASVILGPADVDLDGRA